MRKVAFLHAILLILMMITLFSESIEPTAQRNVISGNEAYYQIFLEEFHSVPSYPIWDRTNFVRSWPKGNKTNLYPQIGIVDAPSGEKSLRLDASNTSEIVYLLHRSFDISIPFKCTIKFSAHLKILQQGNQKSVIFGLLSKDAYGEFIENVPPSEWPFCLVFNSVNSQIQFNNRSLTHYVENEWYTIEVVLDFVNLKWTVNIDEINKVGLVEGIQDPSALVSLDDYFADEFSVGFDGIGQIVLFDWVEVLYSLPISPPNNTLLDQLMFLIMLALSGVAVSMSILLIRSNRNLRRLSHNKQAVIKGERQSICNNPSCRFQEIPSDSKYCPNCGKLIERKEMGILDWIKGPKENKST